jgi:hypothetical protein
LDFGRRSPRAASFEATRAGASSLAGMTDGDRTRPLAEFMARLPEKDAQIIQRGLKAVEQVAHRWGLEDAAKTLDA